MPEAEKTARVTMEWPASLKEKVRDKVGPRGLTPFTLEAVEKLFEYRYGNSGGVYPPPEPEAAPEPIAVTTPLPGDPAEPIVSPPPEPEPVKKSQMRTCDPGCGETYDVFVDGEFEKHMAHKHQVKQEVEQAAEREAPAEPESVRKPAPDLPHDVQSTPKADLFKKLQEEGKELGIDLKPASEVLKPHPKASPPATAKEGQEVCPFHPEMVYNEGHECYKCTLEKNGTDTTPKPRDPEPEPIAEVATCGACGSVLIDGLCFECF